MVNEFRGFFLITRKKKLKKLGKKNSNGILVIIRYSLELEQNPFKVPSLMFHRVYQKPKIRNPRI